MPRPRCTRICYKEGRVARTANTDCSGIQTNEICALGKKTARGLVDSCSGDSGGPLLNTGAVRRELVGITSRGPLPCTSPGIYTRVSAFANWIATNTNNVRLRGNYRLTIGGGSAGTAELRCAATGEVRRASMLSTGFELALDCPASSRVPATCTVADTGYEVANVTRTVNGTTTTLSTLPAMSKTNAYSTTNATDVVAWRCSVVD